MFGRHVAVLAFQRAGLGLGLALLRVSDSEVAQFYVTALGDEHVGGRNVAMNQVHRLALDVFGVVRIIKRVENLHGDEHADGNRQANLLLRGRPE